MTGRDTGKIARSPSGFVQTVFDASDNRAAAWPWQLARHSAMHVKTPMASNPDDFEPSIAAADVAHARVLIYAMNYAPELTGCGRYTGEMGEDLARRGATVTVVTTPPHYPGWRVQPGHANRYANQDRAGARIIRCPAYLRDRMGGIHRMIAPIVFALTSMPVVLWQLIAKRQDMLICVEPTLFGAPAAIVAARLRGTPALLHVQDLELDAAFEVGHLRPPSWLKRLAYTFERMVMRSFDVVITISEAMRTRLIAKGLDPARVMLIRNWVDLDHIRPLDDPSHYRTAIDIPADRFVVLYSGNLGPKQGLDTLGRAATLLVDDPAILFVIAGDGPERDRLLRDYGYLPNLVFRPLQPEAQLGAFLNMADVHVIPQLAGATDFALPSKLAGILASGRPLIAMASPTQEIAHFVGDSAIVIPAEDDLRLVEAIRIVRAGDEPTRRAARLGLAATLSRAGAFDLLTRIMSRHLTRRSGGSQRASG
jgi:colanic acid biosynthesis glycosyl transferase WcaI